MFKRITEPTTEPITLDELRGQLGIANSDDIARDSILTSNIRAARTWIESWTERALMTQSWGYYADAFPVINPCKPLSDGIDLKLDLQSVSSIKYINQSGELTLLDPSQYQVDVIGSRVLPGYGLSWPVTRLVPNAVQISHISGYASAVDVPEDIKKALKIIAGQWENFQHALESGISVRTVSYAAIQLLSPYKDYRKIF